MKERVSLKNQVYIKIKEMIINNELKPNAPVDENTLCQLLNVSRTPIREALNRLDRENFVTLIPKKGARVCDLSIESMIMLFKVREAIEPALVAMACKNIDLDKDKLNNFQQRIEKALEEKNVNELHKIDYEFHTFLYRRSKNPHLIRIMDYITDQFQRIRTQSINMENRSFMGARDHLKMISVLLSGENNDIEELCLNHIKTNEKYFIESLLNL